MNALTLCVMGIVGSCFYCGLGNLFLWMGFNVVQSVMLTFLLSLALTGLAYVVMGRGEDA